jgi:hypothetical protein
VSSGGQRESLGKRFQAIFCKSSQTRNSLRKIFFQLLKKISETNDARELWTNTLKGQLNWQPFLEVRNGNIPLPPYQELGKSKAEMQSAQQRKDAIIITGRFRSGSTLLWNIFRNIDGITAYYEPFNERRWFNPKVRGDKIDATHKNVSDYWQEYVGLESLGKYYREEWIAKNLYMEAAFWAPDMKKYVELLIDRASGRPVLQFNRIDFRLPWFRRNFSGAKIVHIYRHPRDQWCSTLRDPQSFPKENSMDQFPPHDKFYLRMWANDLKYHFPFLDEKNITHPYQMFYYLWKLSYVFGVIYADYSIVFEHLIDDPDTQLRSLFHSLQVGLFDMEKLKTLVESPPVGKWTIYADDEWFKEHEAVCETVLADFFATLEIQYS